MDYVVNDISYKYTPDGKEVLKKVSFTIEKGKVTAIVGPSGCGKSTLVQIFSKVIPKLIGNGELQGTFDVPEGTFVSVVSQSPENQLFGYGVEDAIAFGMENLGLPQEEIMERMEYVLDLLNLQYLRNRSVANLSGGQRQAVCIASVLAMEPDILIMDEPVSSLDPNGKKMVQSILGQLSINGNTTVLVDNNLVWSAGIVDHVIGLLDGEVVFDGSRDDFFRDFELQERLGVIIPQEVEIYRELSRHFPGLDLFYTVEEGRKQIEKLICSKEFTNTEVSEEEKEPIITVHNLGKTFPLNLSMGKKHMLTILSVLFSSADVIVLDEPTLGMDGFLIKELADMIKVKEKIRVKHLTASDNFVRGGFFAYSVGLPSCP